MSEHLAMKKMVGLGLVLGLGLTACTSTPETTPEPAAPSNAGVPEAKYSYYPDGYRLTEFPDSEIKNIWAHCDGDDLVETMDGYSAYNSSSEVRTQNHDACTDDGRLDPADFEFHPSTTASVPR